MYGAMLITPDKEQVLLVEGNSTRGCWTFPRGISTSIVCLTISFICNFVDIYKFLHVYHVVNFKM